MDSNISDTQISPAALLSGIDAIVEGILAQGEADRREGLNTAGFVSGYRGSPLGSLDLELWRAKSRLEEYRVRFLSGLNEDLAATACWGTQQSAVMANPKYDGTFAFWYGKGPGVDRSGDAFKHGNLAGTSAKGGVVLLAGDDHGAKSSSTPHQSEQAFVAASIPVFNPSTIREYIELLPVAVALSRFASVWVGFKCMTETVESSAAFPGAIRPRAIIRPEIALPPGGFHISLAFSPPKLDESLHLFRLPAALAFAKANALDRITWDASARSLGIVAPGKAHVDVLEALRLLRVDERQAKDWGVRIFRPVMTWPLEPTAILNFCRGHREVFVVEEKQPLVEQQLAGLLLRAPFDGRPVLTGKTGPDGHSLLPDYGELSPMTVALALGSRLVALGLGGDALSQRLRELEALSRAGEKLPAAALARAPMFCSGCPHSRSTRLPEGSMAFGGIGCHGMAMWVPELRTLPPTHMGAEGANWIGIEGRAGPDHIFQNMGDGTYAHSGVLSIRAAIAAKSNITFKILYNAAVAMTGGQPVEGDMDAGAIARQVLAEGAIKVALVSEDPQQFRGLPAQIKVYHRDGLDAVQREMRETKGVTAIVYDQGCAAERRRLRKQGLYPDIPVRMIINPEVCEGCGDCNAKSGCVSVVPVETELGTKRAIDQESCNKDYTCATGFCPSFVTVRGGTLKRSAMSKSLLSDIEPLLTDPTPSAAQEPYNILIAGIGGTGVITLGATLARAAALEGRAVLTFDVTGVSQKNGAVFSHVRILGTESPDAYRPRIPRGQLDLLLGCDIVAAASAEATQLFDRDRTHVLASAAVIPTASFQRDPDFDLSERPFAHVFEQMLAPDKIGLVSLSQTVRSTLGQGPLLNVFLLGQAYQRGQVPLGCASIEAAIAEGSSAERNITSFRLGRLCAIDPVRADVLFEARQSFVPVASLSLADAIARHRDLLTRYQSGAYAASYTAFVDQVAKRDGRGELTRAVADNLFRLMRYKDEYEVARLHTDPAFRAKVEEEFGGRYRLNVNLAPPVFSAWKTKSGEPRKFEFGPWMFYLLKATRAFKFLRGTVFDPFGYSKDRRLERALLAEYRNTVGDVLSNLTDGNYEAAVEILRLPQTIKGYGHVKERNAQAARTRCAQMMKDFAASASRPISARP